MTRSYRFRADRFSRCITRSLIALFWIGTFLYSSALAQSVSRGVVIQSGASHPQKLAIIQGPSVQPVAVKPWEQKLEAAARMLIAEHAAALKKGSSARLEAERAPFSLERDAAGRLWVDLLIQLHNPGEATKLDALGIKRRTQVDDIVAGRAPVEALRALADEPAVRFVEISRRRPALLNASRVEIGAEKVHQGAGLPQAYQGEGVIVGVLDSGIDFTHPDFKDANGSRLQYLLEFTQGGGQNVWTKSDLDNNPGSVTQRDGNGGNGHGTHVAGIAAGGGRLNPAMRGIAAHADLIFVKGIRHPDSEGGFGDDDIIAGCQFIFQKAAEIGKPAVINLSLGAPGGPLDGTLLSEQALSNLTGPGKIVVAAAGNEGNDFIHAGGTSQAGILNETLLLPNKKEQLAEVDMWYQKGTIAEVFIFAYDNNLIFLAETNAVPVGQAIGVTAFQVSGQTIGYFTIDAKTVQDPRNGDGQVVFKIGNNNDPNVDVSKYVWGIGSRGQQQGRLDLWVSNGKFRNQIAGFPNETEMPGNTDLTVGTPACAKKVIAVGSYVTKNEWVDVDGATRVWKETNQIGQRSDFSSIGPTRDGRILPNIAAPGELMFSALSSHYTQVERAMILQGGGYQGQQGTSQAAPHVTDVIALMLQAKRDLSYDQIIQIFTQTARTDAQTGSVPNNFFGAGRIDAFAAVQSVITAVDEAKDHRLPTAVTLSQNYPNPFKPESAIRYAIPFNGEISVAIYDLQGRLVARLVSGKQMAGEYTARWDGRDSAGKRVASGVYLYRLEATPSKGAVTTLTKKLTMLK